MRPRPQDDGTLVFPQRGKIPPIPAGYYRNRNNPFVLHPILPACKYRKFVESDCKCGKGTKMRCEIKSKIDCHVCDQYESTKLADKAISYLKATFTGKYVKDDVKHQRIDTCSRCPYQEQSRCVLCGCKCEDLAAHIENLPEWGCKHPRRNEGEGWYV